MNFFTRYRGPLLLGAVALLASLSVDGTVIFRRILRKTEIKQAMVEIRFGDSVRELPGVLYSPPRPLPDPDPKTLFGALRLVHDAPDEQALAALFQGVPSKVDCPTVKGVLSAGVKKIALCENGGVIPFVPVGDNWFATNELDEPDLLLLIQKASAQDGGLKQKERR